MPKFSKSSLNKLKTTHQDLQTIFSYVINYFDCTILYGHRTAEYQFELYKKGRELINGELVIINKKKVVTYKNGYAKKSKHNYNPSLAIDVVPYPIDFKDTKRIRYFAGWVMGIARMLYDYGAIESKITWGGDWDRDTDLNDQTFQDLLHFQIR